MRSALSATLMVALTFVVPGTSAQAQMNPSGGSSDAKAAVVRVICVRK
jgi:hypothetical protein